MEGVCKTNWSLGGQGLQPVRDVYHRACVVHCPKKALVKMKWAAFEEEHENLEKAKEILQQLNAQYPPPVGVQHAADRHRAPTGQP